MNKTRTRDGWLLVEHPVTRPKARVLLLPGLLCTDLIFADMLDDPAMEQAGVELVAGNPPGFKGQLAPAGFDFRVESYAQMVEELARAEGFDLLVGHSYFGNVLIEVAARGSYSGKLLLISPSLYRLAEPNDTRTLDSMSRKPILSGLTWFATYLLLKSIFKPYFTEERRDRLEAVVAEAKKTPRATCRRLLLSLFDYLDQHGDLSERLAATKVPVFYLRGEKDNIGFRDEARATLARSAQITIKDVAGSRHFAMIDRPREVNAILLEMLRA